MDNEDNGPEEITNEAAYGALATSLLAHSFDGSHAETKRMPAGEVISPAEMKTWGEWAAKAPGLIRHGIQQADLQNPPKVTSPFKWPLIGFGAAMGVASFTKLFPGRWKWVSVPAALVLMGKGLYLGHKAEQMNRVTSAIVPDARDMCLDYANQLENNPALRQHLADYFSRNVTAADLQNNRVEDIIAGKALEFGQTTPYLRAADPSCKPCRFTR